MERTEFEVGEGGVLKWGQWIEPRELPEEWVLRQLGNANLDDDGEVVAMLQDFGTITSSFYLPGLVPEDRRALLAHPHAPPYVGAEGEAFLSNWWRQHGGTIEDVRWWLKMARVLTRIWSETMFDRPAAPALAAEGFLDLNTEAGAWWHFTTALNIGLQPFQARVEHEVKVLPGVTLGFPIVDLYSAACRQIFNLIVEDGTARLCENETCSVVFVHQLGGSRYGQYHKTGLRFCSPACARMETQRQYRRREKEKRGGSK